MMKLIGMFRTFSPKSSIFLKVMILNGVILAATFAGVNMYEFHAQVAAGDNVYEPVRGSFYDNSKRTYWISSRIVESNTVEGDTFGDNYYNYLVRYYLSYLDEDNNLNFIEMFGYWTDTNWTNARGPYNHTSYDVSTIIPLGTNYLGVWITENNKIMYYNKSLDIWYHQNGYPTEFRTRHYLVIYDTRLLDDSRTAGSPQYMVNMTQSSNEVSFTGIRYGNDRYLLSWAGIGNGTRKTQVALSTSFGTSILSYVKTTRVSAYMVELFNMDRDLRNGTGYFQQYTDYELPKFDIDQAIMDEYDIDSMVKLPGFDLDNRFMMIDSLHRIHIIGRADVGIINDVEGNYTGQNAPDYAMYDPQTNETYYWDLFPNNAGRYDIPRAMSLNELDADRMSVTFVWPSINDHYSDVRSWDYSPEFNDGIVLNWSRTTVLQTAIFEPEHPSVDNFIQFDPHVSQMDNATITYPRLYQSLEIPGTFAEYGGSLENPDQFQVVVDSANRVSIYAIIHQKSDGQYTQEWNYDIGKSLARIKVDTSVNLPILEGMPKQLGPKSKVNIDYNPKSNQTLFNKDFEGFNIFKIYHISKRSSGAIDIFLKSGYLTGNVVDEVLRDNINFKIHVLEVKS